jgi:hypothetical protein
LFKAYLQLGITNSNFTAEKISQHKYKITDNIRNHGPIEANLVYHQAASDNLPLACLLLNHQITTTCGA